MSHASGFVAPDFEVVVAHYNENLSWLTPLASETIVYTKGTSTDVLDNCKMVHFLGNIGRESHTYLYHIYKNYKRLADVTMFVQGDVYNNDGSAPPHTSLGTREMKRRALKVKAGEVMALGDRRRRFVDWNGIPWEKCQAHAEWLAKQNGQKMTRAERTPGEVWADAVGEAHPYAVYWTEGAIFAVRAETVRQRPQDFYKKLLQMFAGVNEETGHYMERFWYAIFSERYIEWHPHKRREEDKEVVTCKLPDCKAHGVPRRLPSYRKGNGRKWRPTNEALVNRAQENVDRSLKARRYHLDGNYRE